MAEEKRWWVGVMEDGPGEAGRGAVMKGSKRTLEGFQQYGRDKGLIWAASCCGAHRGHDSHTLLANNITLDLALCWAVLGT